VTKKEKEKKRKALQDSYKAELDGCIQDKTPVTDMLIARIAYLAAYLDELQEQTTREGVVTTYNNGGGQRGIRVHPAVQVYVQYHKDFTASLKQLQAFLPQSEEQEDALTAFLKKSK
jgi:hypothetical protein